MARCATCKHWGLHSFDWGTCQLLTDDDASLFPKFRRWVNYSGGEYSITTAKDFGCVLHEPKEGEDGS